MAPKKVEVKVTNIEDEDDPFEESKDIFDDDESFTTRSKGIK